MYNEQISIYWREFIIMFFGGWVAGWWGGGGGGGGGGDMPPPPRAPPQEQNYGVFFRHDVNVSSKELPARVRKMLKS